MEVPNIVEYENPPIEEVAIAVQFAEIDLGLLRLMKLFEVFKAEFPEVEEKPILPARFELFDQESPFSEKPQFELVEGVPAKRHWFVSATGQKLVQLQPDRFVMNWRRFSEWVYPKAEVTIPEFEKNLASFRSIIQQGGDEVLVNQVEVSYFSNLYLLENESYVDALARYFVFWDNQTQKGVGQRSLIDPEATRLNLRSLFSAQKDARGRIYAEVIAAKDMEKKPMHRLQIVARGRPADGTTENVMSFVLECRNQIVQMFEQLTTKEAKLAWGRK